MTANILLTNNFREAGLGELCVNLWCHAREHDMYALLPPHQAEICEIVNTCRVNERHLPHPYYPHLWPVSECRHNIFETVACTKEIRTVDLVHLHTLGDDKVLKVAMLHTAVFLVGVYLF